MSVPVAEIQRAGGLEKWMLRAARQQITSGVLGGHNPAPPVRAQNGAPGARSAANAMSVQDESNSALKTHSDAKSGGQPLPAPPVQPAQPGQRDHVAHPRKIVPATEAGISLYVPIVPVGQMRARHGVANGHARTYKHAKQRRAEETLTAYLVRHQPAEPLDGPVMLGVRAYLPIPKSKSQKWKADAQAGHIRPTVKPDLDNLLKHVKDCLTQCRYWADDRTVVGYLPGTGKYYSALPRWEIEIVPLEGDA